MADVLYAMRYLVFRYQMWRARIRAGRGEGEGSGLYEKDYGSVRPGDNDDE